MKTARRRGTYYREPSVKHPRSAQSAVTPTRKNGRAAYLDLDQNDCDRSKAENIIENMEGGIASTYYSEDKVNFTIETYAAIHRNTFNEMSKADNCTAPDGVTRVRVILSSIPSK